MISEANNTRIEEETAVKTFRWVDTRERNPKEKKHYFALREGGNPHQPYGASPAVHFWYQSEQKWSSRTSFWLEEIPAEVELAALRDEVAKMKTWIPVKKQLPPINQIVIGFTSQGRMLFCWVDEGTKVFDDQDLDEFTCEKFTHWRKKPAGPKSLN